MSRLSFSFKDRALLQENGMFSCAEDKSFLPQLILVSAAAF